MGKTVNELFLEGLKEDIEFFVKNFKEIMKRTWNDLRNDFQV